MRRVQFGVRRPLWCTWTIIFIVVAAAWRLPVLADATRPQRQDQRCAGVAHVEDRPLQDKVHALHVNSRGGRVRLQQLQKASTDLAQVLDWHALEAELDVALGADDKVTIDACARARDEG